MAQGQLPLYYKNSKPVGPTSAKTKWSEYYLLVVTLFGFLMLFAGVLWFLPSIDGDDGYTKAYGGFTGTEPVVSSGTESVVPPVSSQANIAPTLRPNMSAVSNRTASHEQQLMQDNSKSNPEEPVVAKNRSSGHANRNAEKDSVNTLRRQKVVQVCTYCKGGMYNYNSGLQLTRSCKQNS